MYNYGMYHSGMSHSEMDHPYPYYARAEQTPQMPAGATFNGNQAYPQQQVGPNGMLPLEQSFIENILRFNRGKRARFYMTFENNPEWPARVFEGVIDEAGRDHIIVRSEDGGPNYLLLMVNLDFVEFEEDIDYIPPGTLGYAPAAPQR